MLRVSESSRLSYVFLLKWLLIALAAGILASSMNIPIASAVMGVEIFGPQYSLPVTIAANIGFQINRHQTIYDFAMGSKDIEPLFEKDRDT
jgi:H+/Cl- antiporter ClcA